MAAKIRSSNNPCFLGIECGGTRTVALLADAHGHLLKRHETTAANLCLLTDAQLLNHFRALARIFPQPTAIGIGMAGLRTPADHKRALTAATKAWPGIPCTATNDLETALCAPSILHPPSSIRVLVLSGTGSCCYGKDAHGRTAKVGGWGHILGDGGSGYDIGMSALREVVAQFDRGAELSKSGCAFLRNLQLNEPDQLIGWAQNAGKTEIAALAKEVFATNDVIARHVLAESATKLAADAVACAKRLKTGNTVVEFILAGSVLLQQPGFAKSVAAQIKKTFPRATITPLARESAWGAVAIARKEFHTPLSLPRSSDSAPRTPHSVLPLSPTEQRNPRSRNLDKLPTAKAIALMLSEDAKIPAAILAESKAIQQVIGWITPAFKKGGRLFYVGAGTSGRLGILDASECPPTFRTSPELVQGIIAGGQPPIWQAVEGAEDDAPAGASAIKFRAISRRDVVVGIAASGRTPFVLGALAEARKRGAKTVLVCFNPHVRKSKAAHLIIAPDIGPEVLTGSTRLKAGTATKLVLNLFTTLAMIRLGKVVGNLMVDLNPSNVKLRDRAVRIVCALTGTDAPTATQALEKSGWVVKAALQRLKSATANRRR